MPDQINQGEEWTRCNSSDPLATNAALIRASVVADLVLALRRARKHLSVNEIVAILQGMSK